MLVSSDPGVAHTWLRTTYPGYAPEGTNSRRNFLFEAVHEQAGRIGISRLRYSTSADDNVTPEVLLVVRPSSGAMMVRLGREEFAVPPGAPVLLPAGEPVSVLWADTDAACVCLNADDVERVAVETSGLDDLALRFTWLRPMLPGLEQRWNDTVQAVTRAVLRNRRTMAGPVLTGQLAERLAAALLDTFPSTRLATRRRLPPDHATPAVVRRAVDFVDANAECDLTTSDIAAAAGIGPRGLQAAFLRHRDSTPTAYVQRVRLDRAHRELVDTDPADRGTVPAIAARWGFPTPSAFVSAHQHVYGGPPHQTSPYRDRRGD
ncbi:AraC family transcriptional regulator [Geodermatophilus sp. SYSU D01036]